MTSADCKKHNTPLNQHNRNERLQEELLDLKPITTRSENDRSTMALNGQFVNSQLLLDVLLRIKPRATDAMEFHDLVTEQYKDRIDQLDFFKNFKESYYQKKPLRWYTEASCVHKMLNQALRMQNIDLMFLLRSFIRDIYQQLKALQCEQSTRLYRGQLISSTELAAWKENSGTLISNKSFFSTSKNRQVAEAFVGKETQSNGLESVLIAIDADPRNTTYLTPFADISEYSQFPIEKEVLFMPNTVFRLDRVSCNDDGVQIAHLTLCGDDNNYLKPLFDKMKRRIRRTDLTVLGDLLNSMGKFYLAEKYLARSLGDVAMDHRSLGYFYNAMSVTTKGKGDIDSSIKCLEEAIKNFKELKSSDNVDNGRQYNLIGETYRRKEQYDEALDYYEKALRCFEQTENSNDLKAAVIYDNISLTYQAKGDYSNALLFEEKALIIRKNSLPDMHSDFGLSHDIIGINYYHLGQLELALENLTLALGIRSKSLPDDHPDVGKTNEHIALVHEGMNDFQQAIKYLKDAEKIYTSSLEPNHPSVIRNKLNIENVLEKLQRMHHANLNGALCIEKYQGTTGT